MWGDILDLHPLYDDNECAIAGSHQIETSNFMILQSEFAPFTDPKLFMSTDSNMNTQGGSIYQKYG